MNRYPRLFLLALCLLTWLPGFLTLPPSDRDEARFVQATRQMLDSGDYVDIRNGAVARNQKPIGIYWLQAPFAEAARLAHVARANPVWPYRLPSLLGALIAVLATYAVGRRMFGQPAALAGATLLAATPLLAVEAHIAKTDAALLAATTLAMAVLARAYLAPETMSRRLALGFWAALGAGILLKGPITPMVAALTILALLAIERRAAWLRTLRWREGLAVVAVMVLPWLVAIGIATRGRFFADALGHDLGGKLAGGEESHGAWPGAHALMLAVTMFAALPPTLFGLAQAWRRRTEPAYRFLLAWLIPSWLVFEAVPTKLPHYTLPLFPALALIGGAWAADRQWRMPPRWLKVLASVLFVAGAGLLGLAALALPFVARPGLAWVDLLGLPAAAAAAALIWLYRRARFAPSRLVTLAMLGGLAASWTLLGVELPNLAALWIAPRVVALLHATRPGLPAADLAAVGFAEPSLVFLAGTDTALLPSAAAGAAFLAAAPTHVVLVADRDQAAFLAAADKSGLTPQPLGSVRGYNYSRGRRVDLTLYAR